MGDALFRGLIADVRVYTRPLAHAEIRAVCRQPLRLLTADHQDLVQARSANEPHAVSIEIDGAELVAGPRLCFDAVFPHPHWMAEAGFNADRKYWTAHHRRVFRARAEAAMLTLSDWRSATEAGGPVGRELMFNFVEVQPCLAR